MKVNSRQESSELVIELRFDAHDQLCLKHDLVDIVEWYSKGPSAEKIANCRARMIKENRDKLMSHHTMARKTMWEVNALMADPKALCEAISKMDDYKNRVQREAVKPAL
jgi:hypothetical protein